MTDPRDSENRPETGDQRRLKGRFAPGVSGNRGGRPSTKPFTEALKKALAEADPKTKLTNLEAIVLAMITKARQGRTDAAGMILDRLEGKVLSEHKVTGRFEGVMQQLERMTDVELEEVRTRGALPAWFEAEEPKA